MDHSKTHSVALACRRSFSSSTKKLHLPAFTAPVAGGVGRVLSRARFASMPGLSCFPRTHRGAWGRTNAERLEKLKERGGDAAWFDHVCLRIDREHGCSNEGPASNDASHCKAPCTPRPRPPATCCAHTRLGGQRLTPILCSIESRPAPARCPPRAPHGLVQAGGTAGCFTRSFHLQHDQGRPRVRQA